MGLSVSTADTFEYVLIADRARPESERPSLTCRYLSAREYRTVRALKQKMHDATSDDDFFAVALDIIQRTVVGWSNVCDRDGKPIAFDLSRIDDLLSVDDLIEFVGNVLDEGRLSEQGKKLSALRSQSGTANSAASTPAAAA